MDVFQFQALMNNEPLLQAAKNIFSDLTKIQIDVLHALLVSPNHSATAGQIRTLLGLSAVIQVNAALAQVGKKIFNSLGYHPDGWKEGEFDWWHLLASGEQNHVIGFVWTLRPEVVTALKLCGLSEISASLADEIVDSEALTEGSFRKILVNAYERNPVARAKCLAFHGYRCAACELDFEEKYGDVAKRFIHVHHLRPISTMGEEYIIDPVRDLRPVCPNCHAVIHMSQPPYSIEQVKEFLKRRTINA
jgi:5-methylcytosine-specific restriction enzyme A